MEVRELNRDEIGAAMALVWRVFSEFEAPGYSAEGVGTFRAFIAPDEITKMIDAGEMRIWGAFAARSLRGVIAEKGSGHISLFFVQKQYHAQGIGRALFERYAQNCREASVTRITVHSSPYAVEIYRRMGFAPTDTEQVTSGIRYTPMEYLL